MSLKIEKSRKCDVYDITVENNHNFYANGILVHNCTEILEPARPSKLLREELVIREDNQRQVKKTYDAGEIALCNLSSVNLVHYYSLSDEEKDGLIYRITSFMDNTIDIARYPVKEGLNSNSQYRYLGIGVSNYTNLLALNEIVIDTQEALEFTNALFDDLSFRIISASNRLAMERGSFPRFRETNWAKGLLPIDFANKKAMALTKYQPDMKRWRELGEKIKMYGMRNALTMAIAPTATSGKAINATESILPVTNFLYKDEGTRNVTTLAPNFRKNNRFYKKAFDTDQMKLVELAAIRQMWLDQGQSVDLYFRRPDSMDELMRVHIRAFDLGVKTLYYLRQMKSTDDEECESCT